MRGIKVKTKAAKTPGTEALPGATLLLLLAGILGILLLLRSPEGIDFSLWLLFPVTAGLCWGLWFSYSRNRRLMLFLVIGVFLFCGLAALFAWEDLFEQILHVQRSLQGETGQMQVTLLALLFTLLLTVLLFAAECLLKGHAVVYLLTTALLLFSPLLGISASVWTVFLLVLFQLAFWVVRIASKRGKKGSLLSAKSRLAGKSAVAFGLMLSLIFLVAFPLVSVFANPFYDSVYTAEAFVRENLRNLTGKKSKPVTGGKISAGNNYRTGAEHLYLTLNNRPTQPLYLRGFSGGEYLGGDWAFSDDSDILAQIGVKEPEDPTASLFVPSYISQHVDQFYGMYFTLNSALLDGKASPFSLQIQHCNNAYENAYEPYYSTWKTGWNNNRFDSSLAEKNGYQFSYYEQKDMQIDWERVSLLLYGSTLSSSGYLTLRDAFDDQVQEVYTQLPRELLPRLTALVKETPLTELDEITAFILYTLHSNTTYTLSPGWSSFNQDITEYFLFERGTGFCEHYAATATLLYRLYGIPARYATGYIVSPSAFAQESNASYYAVVTDEMAHAWVEIFLKDYGWTPIEVTPSEDGSAVATYPGFDRQRLYRIWQEHGWDVSIPSFSVNRGASALQPETTAPSKGAELDPRDLLLLPFIACCYVILLLPLYFEKRRTRLLQKMDRWDSRAVFYQLLSVLHFGGMLPDSTGSEPDFALQLAERVPNVSKQEAETMVDIVTEAAFGPPATDVERDAFVRSLYARVSESVYAGLSRRKKLAFKWLHVFG